MAKTFRLTEKIRGGQYGSSKAQADALRGFRRDAGVLFASGKFFASGLMQDERGLFQANVQAELAAANRQLAKELQQAIADNLEAERVPSRKAVSSGRLKAAILDPRNIKYAPGGPQFGFGVMVEEFLDHSVAKYWRTIEAGTSQFVGNELYGVWGATLTGEYGGRSRYGPYPIAGPAFSLSTRDRRSDRIRPLPGRKLAYSILRGEGLTAAGAKALLPRGKTPKIIIRRPIQPERYAIGAWEQFDMAAKARAALLRAFYGNVPSKAMVAFDSGRRSSPPPPRQQRFPGRLA